MTFVFILEPYGLLLAKYLLVNRHLFYLTMSVLSGIPLFEIKYGMHRGESISSIVSIYKFYGCW